MIEKWLERELGAVAASLPVPHSNPAVIRRARRRVSVTWLTVGVIVATVITGALTATGALLDTPPSTGDGREPSQRLHQPPVAPVPASSPIATPESDQAAVFAIRALASAGLMDPLGLLYTFTRVTADDGDWLVAFGGGRCGVYEEAEGRVETCKPLTGEDRLGNAKEDSWLRVAASQGSWNVVSVDGNFPEKARGELLAFSLPDVVEDPHWEYPTVTVDEPSAERGGADGEGLQVRGVKAWVGPIPYGGPGTRCQLIGLDANGEVVFTDFSHYEPAAREEWERRGSILSTGMPGGLEIVGARMDCAPYEGRGWTATNVELDARSASTQVIVKTEIEWKDEPLLFAASRCTARVFDESGGLLGDTSLQTGHFWPPSSLEKEPPFIENLVFTVRVGDPELAETADVSCELS